MARFGRGQPHAYIYLRAPFIEAPPAAAPAVRIHVVLAPRQPQEARRSVVVYRRAPAIPQVFAAPVVRLHIVQTSRNPYRPYVSVKRARAPPPRVAIGASRITVVHG